MAAKTYYPCYRHSDWLEYKRDCNRLKLPVEQQLDLLHFRISISDALVKSGKVSNERRRGRPSQQESPVTTSKRRKPFEVSLSTSVRRGAVDPVHSGAKEAGRMFII